MSNLAERIVRYMVGAELLVEDRIDDLVEKHGSRIPGSTPEAKRQTLEHWSTYDPTRNKKYFPWMFKQFITGKVTWDDHTLDHVRDLLGDFEHYLSMPAFDAPRDIYRYDYKALEKTVRENSGLTSKRDLKRGRESLGGTVLSQVGDLEVVGFRDGNSLAEEAWRAYDKNNPNWDGKPLDKEAPEYNTGTEPHSVDHLWCIRNPRRGADYISGSPSKMFYVVRKGGWPYVGAVLAPSSSQIVNLQNRQIDAGQTDEIYDVFKPILDEHAEKKWDTGYATSHVFGKLRIIRGELQPGETIQGTDLTGSAIKSLPHNLTVNGDLNLTNTAIKALPDNLTVNGSLIVAGTSIRQLPPGLSVKGSLNLSGTKISSVPQGLVVGSLDISNTPVAQLPSGLEINEALRINGTAITTLPPDLKVSTSAKVYYSPETLPEPAIRQYFFYLRKHDLKLHFYQSEKVKNIPDSEKEAAWEEFQPGLIAWFQKAPPIGQAIAAMFVPVRSEKPEKKKRR